ncbi:hypothetical protein Y717_19150 [Streptomyces scopuliridis RB72]|uniref:Uncharacterized protein n=1 Tax=Streptomyces scopuliridis RB72 TaxID=1440053 RepID=A0A2T7TE07_9ACTN|nr:hypothetical protein Y717_19150 [Streptomyces scopuliridis RB72]
MSPSAALPGASSMMDEVGGAALQERDRHDRD